MFGIGWSEFIIIFVIGIIVIGPDELPNALRNLGKFFRKIKQMSNSFTDTFDDAMGDLEMEEITNKANSKFKEQIKENVEKETKTKK